MVLLLLIQWFVTFFRILYICVMFLTCINKSDDGDDDDDDDDDGGLRKERLAQ